MPGILSYFCVLLELIDELLRELVNTLCSLRIAIPAYDSRDGEMIQCVRAEENITQLINVACLEEN